MTGPMQRIFRRRASGGLFRMAYRTIVYQALRA
jgi:hypothetical protein